MSRSLNMGLLVSSVLVLSIRSARAAQPLSADASEKAAAETGSAIETETAPAAHAKKRRHPSSNGRAATAPADPSRADAGRLSIVKAAPAQRTGATPATVPGSQEPLHTAEDLPETSSTNQVPGPPPTSGESLEHLGQPLGGFFSVGIGGGRWGATGRLDLGLVPIRRGPWFFAGILGFGISGAHRLPLWLDVELTAQASREWPLWGGRLVLTGGVGPGLAKAFANSCDSPLCGYAPGGALAVVGAFQGQAGWWMVHSAGFDVGFILGLQVLTNAQLDATLNVAFGLNDLREFMPVVQSM